MKRERDEYKRTHWGNAGTRPPVNLRTADPDEVRFVLLGVLETVVYRTAKGRFASEELWEHDFEHPKPLLCYSPKSKLLLIAGGGYTVTSRGIER